MQNYKKIDIEFLSSLADSHSIRNFYLTEENSHNLFLSKSPSFLFNGFAIMLCTGGSSILKISGKEYTLSKNSLLLYSPNQLIETKSFSEDWSRKSIFISIDLLLEFPSPIDANILNFARHTPVITMPEEKLAHLCEYYKFIEQQYTEVDNLYRNEITKNLLYVLILEICNLYRSTSKKAETGATLIPRQEKIFDEFILLLGKHYKQERAITFYAEKMNFTPKYLSTSIKEISGRSAAEWIREVVICEIKTLLKTTDYTVQQISEMLNFSSPSIFVQYFKHYTGISPHKYRTKF